jgi:hypothetical protein
MTKEPPVSTDDRTVAEIEAGMGENVRLGYMEIVGVDESGQPTYRLTEAGKRRVEAMGLPVRKRAESP